MDILITGATNHPWAIWILIAVLAGLLEMTVPYFTFLFASIAALVAALVSLGYDLWIQAVAFAFTTLISIFFVRPKMLEKLHIKNKIPSRSQAVNGLVGVVTTPLDPIENKGRVLVNGQDWAAQSEASLAVGQKIVVMGSDGIVLLVKGI